MTQSSTPITWTESTSVPPEDTFMAVFDNLDVDSSGLLSLTAVEQAVRQIWPHFNNEESVIHRAYNATDFDGDGLIGREEFELLLHFLSHYSAMRHYCEGTSSDFRISKGRFVTALSRPSVDDSEKAFDDMDVGQQGYLMLDEVCLLMATRSARHGTEKGTCYHIANPGASKLLFNSVSSDQKQTRINRVFLDLKDSMQQMNLEISDETIESWAILINECVATKNNSYHNLRRVFDMSHGADPVQVVAACFQGCIRYEFFGLPPAAAKLLQTSVVIKNDGDMYCPERDYSNAPHDAMVMDVFRYKSGLKLTFECGKSNFLCALLAARALGGKVPMSYLTRIVVCIQATTVPHLLQVRHKLILFAQQAQSGESSHLKCREVSQSCKRRLDALYESFAKINKKLDLRLTDAEMTRTVQLAADFANRSYRAFCLPDTGKAMDLLWAWLSEMNPALRERKMYTVNDYHLGIKLAGHMMAMVQPEEVYASFRGVPEPTDMDTLIKRSHLVKEFGKEHTNAHSVSLALLAAFAILTGGNAPISFFVGDHPSELIRSDQLGECLPTLSSRDLVGCNEQVYDNLMAKGRRTDAVFDMGMSLVTAFVYGKLGSICIERVLKYTDYPMDEVTAKELIRNLPLDVVVPIGKEIARIAISRTEAFEQLLRGLHTGVNATSA